MGYQNRQPPEGINAQTGPWVGGFLRQLVVFALGVIALVALLLWALAALARYTPFAWEQNLVSSWPGAENDSRKVEYLQDLADELARAGGLNQEFAITLHSQPGEMINAYATLGGHIVMFDGLLEKLPSENALAFVLAHEIAHIQKRHPVQSAARQLGLTFSLALIFGNSDLGGLAHTGGALALFDYSRDAERAADRWAYRALSRHYGHVAGSEVLFELLAEQYEGGQPPAWLSTHPHTGERLENRLALAETQGWTIEGETTPLPNWWGDDNDSDANSQRENPED